MMGREVLVFSDEQAEGVRQPDTFRCCPLGIQFYSSRELPTYRVLELTLTLPDENDQPGRPVDCSGVVVHSQLDEERELYRTWVMFADLPREMRENFQCFAKESDFLCPHCENY